MVEERRRSWVGGRVRKAERGTNHRVAWSGVIGGARDGV